MSYNTFKDKIVGIEDFGDPCNRTNLVATSVLVFMVRSIAGKWKQPLAYFYVNEQCKAEKLMELLCDAIDKLKSIDLKMFAV